MAAVPPARRPVSPVTTGCCSCCFPSRRRVVPAKPQQQHVGSNVELGGRLPPSPAGRASSPPRTTILHSGSAELPAGQNAMILPTYTPAMAAIPAGQNAMTLPTFLPPGQITTDLRR